jgi:metal-dependent hydrolase (beta-lactamase superfamily II)
MRKYKIWDKQSDIITPGIDSITGKQRWTAEEYITTHAQWASSPDVKVIITGGVINGGVFMEFEQTKEFYKKQGANIQDNMTDDEVLLAIEDWEDNPPVDNTPTPEERTAAMLEALVMMQMEDN